MFQTYPPAVYKSLFFLKEIMVIAKALHTVESCYRMTKYKQAFKHVIFLVSAKVKTY